MTALMPVAEALAARARRCASRCRPKRSPLDDALGRVLADDMAALRTQPPAAVSAMDGYAVRAADVAQAPATLKLIGEVAAGHPFDGEVGSGRSRAHLHRRRDAGRRRHRGDPGTHRARRRHASPFRSRPPRAAMCRSQGIDFTQGAGAAAQRPPPHRPRPDACRRHEPSDAAACTAGPKWRCSAPATNWCAPGSTPGPGEIVYSNGFALIALARSEGAEVDRSRHRAGPRRGHRGGGAPRARLGRRYSGDHAAAPRSASTTWCSGRSPPKGSTCRSGGWRCAPAGR